MVLWKAGAGAKAVARIDNQKGVVLRHQYSLKRQVHVAGDQRDRVDVLLKCGRNFDLQIQYT